MKKLSKSELLNEYHDQISRFFVVTDNNGYIENFWYRGNIASIISAFPDNIVYSLLSYSEVIFDKNTYYRKFHHVVESAFDKMTLNDLIEMEDGGTDVLVVYAPNLQEAYSNLIRKMYPYEVTDMKVKRQLGKNACKMLFLLGKKVEGVYQYGSDEFLEGRKNFPTRQEYEEALNEKVNSYKKYIKGVLRRTPLIDYKQYSYEDGIVAFISAYKVSKLKEKKMIALKEREEKKVAEKFRKEQEKIVACCDDARSYYDVKDLLLGNIRLGENLGNVLGEFSQQNNLECNEKEDYDGYSRRCKFTMIRRSFTLHIQKGYRMRFVGGLLTFYRGSFNRDGMAVEWIQQGKAIADITKHTGFLVRGEHIEANSLREARRINAEHRAMKLARLLNTRKRAERREEMKANGNLMITFSDSLKAGNCRPGTQEFKNKYEAAIGHEAKSISTKDLRKYAKKFGVSYYAEQAIEYALNH